MLIILGLWLMQADGFGMNVVTLGVVVTLVGSLVGAITFLFRYASSNQDKYIDRLVDEKRDLEDENRELMEALIDVLRTAHRSTDVADDAARELLKRRAVRSKK